MRGRKRKSEYGLVKLVNVSLSPEVAELLEKEATETGNKSAVAEKIFRLYFKLPEVKKAS